MFSYSVVANSTENHRYADCHIENVNISGQTLKDTSDGLNPYFRRCAISKIISNDQTKITSTTFMDCIIWICSENLRNVLERNNAVFDKSQIPNNKYMDTFRSNANEWFKEFEKHQPKQKDKKKRKPKAKKASTVPKRQRKDDSPAAAAPQMPQNEFDDLGFDDDLADVLNSNFDNNSGNIDEDGDNLEDFLINLLNDDNVPSPPQIILRF